MPLIHKKSDQARERNIHTLMSDVGKSPHVQSPEQALAIAYSVQRRAHKQAGGATKSDHKASDPSWWQRFQHSLMPPNSDGPMQNTPGNPMTGGPMGAGNVFNSGPMQQGPMQRFPYQVGGPVAPQDWSWLSKLGPPKHAAAAPRWWQQMRPSTNVEDRRPPPRPTPSIRTFEGQGHLHDATGRQYGGGAGANLSSFPGAGAAEAMYKGPIKSAIAGRTDKLQLDVKPGSYIIPADIVSALGEGNTDAGHKVIGSMFSSPGPTDLAGGKNLPHGRGSSAMHMKSPQTPGRAHGGGQPGTPGAVPIVAAGGEHVLTPEQIKAKFGDLKRGHDSLDAFVRHVRKQHIKTLASLPGPKK